MIITSVFVFQSQAFSNRALHEQEDVVRQYVDELMAVIAEESRKGPIDMKDFYNWFTFDGADLVTHKTILNPNAAHSPRRTLLQRIFWFSAEKKNRRMGCLRSQRRPFLRL
jgi:hypothetical protein